MKVPLLCFSGLLILNTLYSQQKRIYIAPDDHTDYMWSGDERVYRTAFTHMLDYYIHLNDSTSADPYPYRSKWNCDGSFWVWEYEKNRSRQQFLRLIEQIRIGSVTVPLNTLPGLPGVAPLEAAIRDMYYAGSLERRFGLDLDLAIDMEDQVLPLGLSSLWAGAGAKYSWRGVCNCATRVKGLHNRPHEIYWYKGTDDQKILMKWYSLGADNRQLGGYAEARDPVKSVNLCIKLMGSRKYPWQISAAFGKGWDDLQTTTDEFISVAKEQSGPDCQVIVSDESDFFKDFEKTYGSVLPSESVSYGSSEWGNGLASLAAVSASVKRSVEKLRAAEALYTLVSLKDPQFGGGLDSLREMAWIACGLYFDHDWTADSPIITKKQRAEWARKKAGEIITYVDTLYDLSLKRLGSLIIPPRRSFETFFVFNPLGWERTDYCDYHYSGDENVKVVRSGSSNEVPYQFITKNNIRYLRILARNIPSLGFNLFEIRHVSEALRFEPAAALSDGIIENDLYKITLTPGGVITSLICKNDNNREWIRPENNLYANDLGSSTDAPAIPLKIENAGAVSFTVETQSAFPLKHRTRLTLFGFSDRIEIENYLEQNFGSDPVTFTFSFNLDETDIHNEEAGAILLARQQAYGGDYADSICRLDWIALNHFADLSDRNRGIVISNRDAFLMKTGSSTVEKLDPFASRIAILAGGQIDAPSLGIAFQDGDTYFENFFAMHPYNHGFNAAESMKFSMEHQNPLIAGEAIGREGYSGESIPAFSVSCPEVIVWAVKPSEEGIGNGIIIRLWNMSNTDKEVVVSSPGPIEKCFIDSHIEKDISEVKPSDGVLKLKIGHNRLVTYRIFLKQKY